MAFCVEPSLHVSHTRLDTNMAQVLLFPHCECNSHWPFPSLQIFLVSDIIYSFLVHRYDLQHGLPRVDAEGKPLRLKLS